jgi:hypothetical protein
MLAIKDNGSLARNLLKGLLDPFYEVGTPNLEGFILFAPVKEKIVSIDEKISQKATLFVFSNKYHIA